MPIPLDDKNVLVIGASSGIGREAARLFVHEGARVGAAARRLDRLQTLLDELESDGKTIEIFQADASKLDEMQRLGEETLDKWGTVDVLVYSAGNNTPDRAMTRLNSRVWSSLLDVNLSGAYYITQALLPHMRTKKAGHLIYIASISGLFADVSGAAYQASKRGLIGFAHAIRVEEKENGIRTCAVCPGLVDTELVNKRPVKPGPETLSKALQAKDVAEFIVAIAKMPPHVVIPEVEILPTLL